MLKRVRLLLFLPFALCHFACVGCHGPDVELAPDGGIRSDAGTGGGEGGVDAGDTQDAGSDAGHSVPDEVIAYYGYESIDGGSEPNGTSNVWVRKADGTSPLAVTNLANATSQHPFFNWTRTRLVYISNQSPTEPLADVAGRENVWTFGPAGTAPVTRFNEQGTAYFARWTADERIVFSAAAPLDGGDGTGPVNLWISAADGTSRAPITTVENPYLINPHNFAVDQETVYYASDRPLESGEEPAPLSLNIWKAPLAGGPHLALTQNLLANSDLPVPSPDGSQVAFISDQLIGTDVDGNQSSLNVWLVNRDGSNARPLTTFKSATVEGKIAWTDDGASIVFSSNCESTAIDRPVDGLLVFNLFKLDVASGAVTPLAFHEEALSRWPMVLTTDKHVVFESGRALDGGSGINHSNLWVIGADGTGLSPVTSTANASSRTAVSTF